MHRVLLWFLMFGLHGFCHTAGGQSVNYAASFGSAGIESGYCLGIGPDNDHYYVGSTSGPVDLDPTGPGAIVGAQDTAGLFVMKRSSAGAFLWAFSLKLVWEYGTIAAAVADNGDVVIGATIHGPVDMDPDDSTTFMLSGTTSARSFVARYSSDGHLVWAKLFAGSWSAVYDLAFDGVGNIYAIGEFDGPVDFDPGGTTHIIDTHGDHWAFLCKLDGDGALLWAGSIGLNGESKGQKVVVDGLDNVVITGRSRWGSTDLDPGPDVLEHVIDGNTFHTWVIKLDADGHYLWSDVLVGDNDCLFWDLAVDDAGDVYSAGDFEGTYDLDPSAGVDLVTSDQADGLLWKLSGDDGSVLRTAVYGGAGWQRLYRLAKEQGGFFYAHLYASLPTDLDPGSGVAYPLEDGGLLFCKYDTALNYEGHFQLPCSTGTRVAEMAVDHTDNLVITGALSGTFDVDPSAGEFELVSQGSSDIWILSLGDIALGIPASLNPTSHISLCQGDGLFQLDLPEPAAGVEVLDGMGRLLWRTTSPGRSLRLDLSSYDQGMYLVRVTCGEGFETHRFLVE